MRSLRPRKFQLGGSSSVPSAPPAPQGPSIAQQAQSQAQQLSQLSQEQLVRNQIKNKQAGAEDDAGMARGGKVKRFQTGGSNPATVGASTLPTTWNQYINQPGLQQQNPGLYAALQQRLADPTLGASASAYGSWARPFLGQGTSAGPQAPGATASGSSGSQQNPAQTAAPQTTQPSDQQLAVQNADRLRAAAAALTTGPAPVGAQAAQKAQSALGGLARGGKVRAKRFQSGGVSLPAGVNWDNLSTAQQFAFEAGDPNFMNATATSSIPSSSTQTTSTPPPSSSAPTGAQYASWTPAQQQAYSNGVPVAQVNAMTAPAAAAPAATGPSYSYNPYAPPSQNPTPPAGYVAVPFGSGTGAGGTSVVPTADTYAQTFQALNQSPMMTPAALANEYAVGNAGLPASLQGNATVTVNGQQVPYSSMTPEQQYVYGALTATGQAIPANFMSTYQGPNTPWNQASLNNVGAPSGTTLVNGAYVNNTGGGFAFPGSYSGQQPASPTAAPTTPNTSSPGGIGTSPGTFTSNAAGTGVGTGSGATGTTPVTATPAVATGSAGSGTGLGLRKGGKVPRQHRPRRFQAGGFNAAPGGTGNWQQALQQMIQNAQAQGGAQMMPQGGQFQPTVTGTPGGGGNLNQQALAAMPQGMQPGTGGAQGMGAAAGAMPPSPGAAAMGAMAGASPGMGQPRPMFGPPPGAAAAGMGAMAGAMPGSPGAAAMGALAGASQGAPGGAQNMQALMQALQARGMGGGAPGGMGGTFGPTGAAIAPGAGAAPGSSFGAAATPNQQWGQMLLGSAPGTGLMDQSAANPLGQQALWRNYLANLQGGQGMTGMQNPGMTGMAHGGSVPPRPDEHNDVTGGAPVDPRHGSHYRVPLRGGEHELASHPDQQWGLIADGERPYAKAKGGRMVIVPASREAARARRGKATGGTVDESPETHASGVPMSRRKATGGRTDTLPTHHASGVPMRKATGGITDTAPTHHASGVPIRSSPSGGQPLGTVSKFDSTKGAPGNLKTTAAGRGRGFAHGGAIKQGPHRTLDSTKPAPGNLATSQAGRDRFADGGVAAFAAGGPHEAVKPKTSKNVLRRRPAPMPHSPDRRRPVPTPPYRDQDNEDAMGPAPTAAAAPAPSPAPPPPNPPPFAKGGAVCASCGKAHGGACKGMARGGKFVGSKQRQIRRAGGGKWVQDAIKRPGALRAALHVKSGENIPAGKLAKAAKAPGRLGRQARLAETMRGFKHAKGGAAACPDCGKKHSGECKMAAGGAAKVRRGFPNTLKPPKRLARGGTVRGGGAAKRGLKFSGVF